MYGRALPGWLVRGTLSVATPVPLHVLARVDVLVSWSGPSDMLPQLLYRAAPTGDPFAVVAAAVAPTVVAAAKSGTNRQHLKRRRLG